MVSNIQVRIQILCLSKIAFLNWSKAYLCTPLLNLTRSIFKYFTIYISIGNSINTNLKVFLRSICFSFIRRNTSIVILLLNKSSIREITYYFIINFVTLGFPRDQSFLLTSPTFIGVRTIPQSYLSKILLL